MIGGVTSGKRLLIFCTLVEEIANMGISNLLSQKMLDQSQPWNYSALIDTWVGIVNLTFVLRSLKGRCNVTN